MKTIATIEARMNSSRLPGKVMLPILGKPALQHLVERLQRAKSLDGIVIATTTHPADAVIEKLAAKLGVGCFRGSENDVLDRVLRAARTADAGLIVEITGDCPLIDPAIVDMVLSEFAMDEVDYAANILPPTWPNGMDVQVFPLAVLDRVAQLTSDPADREHVSLYIYQHPQTFRLRNVESGLPAEVADWRLTLDTSDDFELITRIYEALYPRNSAFGLDDIMDLFRCQPELLDLNRHIVQKATR